MAPQCYTPATHHPGTCLQYCTPPVHRTAAAHLPPTHPPTRPPNSSQLHCMYITHLCLRDGLQPPQKVHAVRQPPCRANALHQRRRREVPSAQRGLCQAAQVGQVLRVVVRAEEHHGRGATGREVVYNRGGGLRLLAAAAPAPAAASAAAAAGGLRRCGRAGEDGGKLAAHVAGQQCLRRGQPGCSAGGMVFGERRASRRCLNCNVRLALRLRRHRGGHQRRTLAICAADSPTACSRPSSLPPSVDRRLSSWVNAPCSQPLCRVGLRQERDPRSEPHAAVIAMVSCVGGVEWCPQ